MAPDYGDASNGYGHIEIRDHLMVVHHTRDKEPTLFGGVSVDGEYYGADAVKAALQLYGALYGLVQEAMS